MAFEDEWQQLLVDEATEYSKLNTKERNKLVRRFAQRVARKEVSSSDPRMKAFLEANLTPVKVIKEEIPTFGQEMSRTFRQSDVGSVLSSAVGVPIPAREGPPSPRMERITKAYQKGYVPMIQQAGSELFGLAKGAGKAVGKEVITGFPSTREAVPEAIQRVYGDATTGFPATTAAAGAVTGVIPDIAAQVATGFGAGKLVGMAAKKAIPAAAKYVAPVAGVIAQAPLDYMYPYAGTKARGGTEEQAHVAGLLSSTISAPLGFIGASREIRGAMSPPAAAGKGAAPPPPRQAEMPSATTERDPLLPYANAQAARERASAELDSLRASNASREQISLAEEKLAAASAREAQERDAYSLGWQQRMAAQQAAQPQPRPQAQTIAQQGTMQRMERIAQESQAARRTREFEREVKQGELQLIDIYNQVATRLNEFERIPLVNRSPLQRSQIELLRKQEEDLRSRVIENSRKYFSEEDLPSAAPLEAGRPVRQPFSAELMRPQEMIPPSRQLAAPTGRPVEPTSAIGQQGFVAQTPVRGFQEAMYSQAVNPQDIVNIQAQRQAAQQAYDGLIASPAPTAPKAAAVYQANVNAALNRLNQLRDAEMNMIQRAQEIYPQMSQPIGLGVAERVEIPGVPQQSTARGKMSPGFTRDIPSLAIPQRPPAIQPAAFEEVIIPPTPKSPTAKAPTAKAPTAIEIKSAKQIFDNAALEAEAAAQRFGEESPEFNQAMDKAVKAQASYENLLEAKAAASAAGKKKAPSKLKQLITEEEGLATPEAALSVLSYPVKAARDLAVFLYTQGANRAKIIAASQAAQDAMAAAGSATLKTARAVSGVSSKVGDLYVGAQNVIGDISDRIGVRPKWQGLTEAAIDILHTKADTPFPALSAALDTIRKWTVNDWGVPAGLLMAREEAEAEARRHTVDMYRYANGLLDKFGTDKEQLTRIYRGIEDRNYQGGDPDIIEGKRLIAVGSKLLNDYKALGDQAHERWGGSWMPREYQHWIQQNAAAGALMGSFRDMMFNDHTLSGYYHRGVRKTVSEQNLAKLLAENPSWEIIDRRTIASSSLRRARTRAQKAYDNAVSAGDNAAASAAQAKIADIDDQIAKTSKVEVDIFRDWTPEERAKWGENTNVAEALHRYSIKMRKEIQNSGFLSRLKNMSDENGAYAIDAEDLGYNPNNPANLPPKRIERDGQTYYYMGDERRKSGDVYRYGALAKQYVRDDIYGYIKFNTDFGGLKRWTKAIKKATGQGIWKEQKTVWNPSYYQNNMYHVFPTVELTGGTVFDLPEATLAIRDLNSEFAQKAIELGVIRDTADQKEFAMRLSRMFPVNAPPDAGKLAKGLSAIQQAYKGSVATGHLVSENTDDIARATIMYSLMKRKGLSAEEAAAIAKDAVYNRKNVNAPIVDVVETVSPFAAVTHHEIAKTVYYGARNPLKGAMMVSLASVTPALALQYHKMTPEEFEALKELLPKYMQDPKIFGFKLPFIKGFGYPSVIPTGKDAQGMQTVFDMSNLNRLATLSSELSTTALPFFPKALAPGGYPADIAALMYNVDPSTGQVITEKDALGRPLSYSPYGRLGTFIEKSVVPPVFVKGADVARSMMGTNFDPRTGAPVTTGTAIQKFLGTKIRTVDVAKQFERDLNQYDRAISQIKSEQRMAELDYERAIQNNNQKGADEALAKIMEFGRRINQTEMEKAARMQQTMPALNLLGGQR